MFLGHEDLPFRFLARAPVTAVQITLPTWPPCSDLGFPPEQNLIFLRYCAREYWDYLQFLRRKAEIFSSPPLHHHLVAFSSAQRRTPASCRIGLDLLLDIAQQPQQAIRLLVAAVHVQVCSMFWNPDFYVFNFSFDFRSLQPRMCKFMACVRSSPPFCFLLEGLPAASSGRKFPFLAI